ncbi:MAG: hypothetical protein JXR49_14805 [Acidobacteria bacterium]|nr:hypothetical protein [Acidobacteriota bacterium]
MAFESILDQLGVRGADIGSIADQLVKNRRHIPLLVEALQVEKSSKKYAYEKTLRLVSEMKPELLYPHFDVFVRMLDNDNSFLKWGAIMTVANLTAVDTKNRFEKIFRKYYAPIGGPVMVTAANVIGSSEKIVRAKPELADAVTKEILKVEKSNYLNKGEPSPECRNVAIGQAIDAFDQFYDRIGPKTKVLNFVKRQLTNTRKQVAGKAERFMKKHA